MILMQVHPKGTILAGNACGSPMPFCIKHMQSFRNKIFITASKRCKYKQVDLPKHNRKVYRMQVLLCMQHAAYYTKAQVRPAQKF